MVLLTLFGRHSTVHSRLCFTRNHSQVRPGVVIDDSQTESQSVNLRTELGSPGHLSLARPGLLRLLPSTGWEEPTSFKPDHTAVAVELAEEFRAPQYQGLSKAPAATLEDASLRFWIEPTEWAAALAGQDVEKLWELWNNAAVAALEVRPQGRGVLCLENKTLRPPKEDKESTQDAMRQHLEASLLRTARTGQA
eukprot:1769564-Amphidinium_carterae.2